MSAKLEQIRELAKTLTLADMVSEKGKLLSYEDIVGSIRRAVGGYYISEYYETLVHNLTIANSGARDRKVAKEKCRALWCKENLAIGDWVKVTGTSTSKYRLITRLRDLDFENVQGNPNTKTTNSIMTLTTYGKVTERFNTVANKWESIL